MFPRRIAVSPNAEAGREKTHISGNGMDRPCPRLTSQHAAGVTFKEEPPAMPRKPDLSSLTAIGIDAGKNSLRLIGLDAKGSIVLKEKVARSGAVGDGSSQTGRQSFS